MQIKRLILSLFFVLFLFNFNDVSAKKVELFDVSLDQKYAPFEELKKKYLMVPIYENYYDFSWNIGTEFREDLKKRIAEHAATETRIVTKNDKYIEDLIDALPKYAYPYVGPYLHTVRGISDKVLNMPGIKETKNTFPTRIAPQLRDVEDLEWISPQLYFLLMPESWPENAKLIEKVDKPKPAKKRPPYDLDKKFLWNDLIKQYLKADKLPDTKNSNFRTMNVTKTSALTSADVVAFAQSVSTVEEFLKNEKLQQNLLLADAILFKMAEENNKDARHMRLQQLVNPCQSFVRKLQVVGEDREFYSRVSKHGFSDKTWAYTCDKTVRAFRASQMTNSTFIALMRQKKGKYNPIVAKMKNVFKTSMQTTQDAFTAMYEAPYADVLEVKKNSEDINAVLQNDRFSSFVGVVK